MERFSFPLFCLLYVLVSLSTGQHHLRARMGPWRHRIQWENNGRMYSLLSTGSEYLAQARRLPAQLYLTTNNDFNTRHPPSPRDTVQVAGYPGARPPSQGGTGSTSNGTGSGALQEFSGSGITRGGRNPTRVDVSLPVWRQVSVSPVRSAEITHESNTSPTALSALSNNGVEAHITRSQPQQPRRVESNNMIVDYGDDPTDPNKNHQNSVFYNGRTREPVRLPPGTGYGTRLLHNGLPDLVPDPYYIQAASYIQRVQMYALRCAGEENCLSRSAYRPGVRDIDYRTLLRFPQRVKNQGTADFLPVKPRHQWEWHSCHQHYHSMEAFSNYDLLDVITGRKVAEGHKASFCLEDTSCDPGVRRRFACTAHTQGLGPGCYDTYNANIDCQWIDITDVPPGNYILKVTVNPTMQVQESDFSNNIVKCDIRYTGSYVHARNCRITG
uniref:Lysyl oxidase homolog n=1 Tax=Salmo trutta TaxID=8032 RepID=A0A673WC40_SALTR